MNKEREGEGVQYTPEFEAWIDTLGERVQRLRDEEDIQKATYLKNIRDTLLWRNPDEIGYIAGDIRVGLWERVGPREIIRLGIPYLDDLSIIQIGVSLVDPDNRSAHIKKILEQIERPK